MVKKDKLFHKEEVVMEKSSENNEGPVLSIVTINNIFFNESTQYKKTHPPDDECAGFEVSRFYARSFRTGTLGYYESVLLLLKCPRTFRLRKKDVSKRRVKNYDSREHEKLHVRVFKSSHFSSEGEEITSKGSRF